MTIQKIFDIFLEKTYSLPHFYYHIQILKEFFEELFFSDIEKDISLKDKLRTFLNHRKETKEIKDLFESLPPDSLKVFTPENLYSLIQSLKDNVKKTPVITIYIPSELGNNHLDAIGTWVKKNIGTEVLVSTHIRSEVAGGCALVHKSTYYDFSFPYFFNLKEDEITDMIHARYEQYRTEQHKTH